MSPSCAIGRTVSRFLFYPVIYLLDLPPGKERAALLSLRTLRYTWSFWSWCRHHRMSPHGVVSSCLAVSPLPLTGGLFSVTASIRLLPSVLSTAGCPFQSGLSSESKASEETVNPQSTIVDSPEGHAVFTSFRPATYCPYVFLQKTRTRSRRLMPSW